MMRGIVKPYTARMTAAALAVLAAIALWILAPPAMAEDPTTMYVLVEEGSCLRVHERASMGSGVCMRLDRGDELTVYDVDKYGWAEISRAGDPGYCRIEYLSDQPPTDPVEYVTNAGKVNVRKTPGGDMVRKLERGETVTVTGWMTDKDGTAWANIGEGYVMAEFLEVGGQ